MKAIGKIIQGIGKKRPDFYYSAPYAYKRGIR